MEEKELKTSVKQRIGILLIAVIMVGSIIASYVAIVANGSGSSSSVSGAEISDENFTEEDRQNAMYLWKLLISTEPFNETEKKIADGMLKSYCIDEMLLYSKECGHMNQEVCDKLMDYLDFIFEDPLHGYLYDMLIEYYMEM